LAFENNAKQFIKDITVDRKNPEYNNILLEEHFAEHIVSQIELVDDAALQDPDFWRYLTLFPYRTYVQIRENNFSEIHFGGSGNKALNRWTLIRGLLWGLRTVSGDDASYVSAHRIARIKHGLTGASAVFYIENIVRRKWAGSPQVARAFIDVTTSPSPRPLFERGNKPHEKETLNFGSLIGRASENVYFPALDGSELQSYLQVVKDRNFSAENLDKSNLQIELD
jgi:hypothetical protein